MIDVKIIKKPKSGRAAIGGGIVTAGNSYTNDSQQTLADVLNFNAAVSRLLQPYDANNQPLAWAQATDPDGDGGIRAKTLRASVTFASVGDVVAFQNGNLSGGTGGGGLDITALEDYLTTNGYATQAWVSAHFNDYVLTKAAVEAVLTGNITTHTHNQYLTEHQSLANYYTKTESDGKYLTTITKSMVEAVLTGNITTHTHSQYLTAHQSLANYYTKAEVNTELGKYLLSSAYTASDILTKIKTVDGAGSGLDADMLDGYQALDFLRNRDAVSTADVHMNINEVPANSVQHDYRWDNAPTYYNYIASVLDLTYSPDWRTQLFVFHTAKTHIFARSRHSGTTWGDWRELAFTVSNVASATKLQTARTIWGQSFNGTANVSGSLSGVEDITFNANAKIAATANHLRLLTKSDGAQGLAAAQLLASDLYADWAKVPENGIYSKGDIATDGSLKIGGGTITWDAGNNAFMFSHTVASQGDMVAFQNGNLSGGSGGGGLDITALESYLTTNGYATQDWVTAHFNDYVLTKAAVEAVLTGNITTHTHNQYLTEHQSLANYYTKTEADGKYLTAINKSMVEAVLTGNITTHTHSQYLTEHQSLANYMTRGEIGDTYQAKSTALSFSAASGYVAARFTNTALVTSAAQNYIELWGKDGWFNLQAGYLLAHGAVTATSFVKTGGTASQFLKADGSIDTNTYLTTGAASDTYLPKATYTASDILTKIKTVDGAGSGLDADLLDGVHGKGYMYYNAYNFGNGYLVRLKFLASGNDTMTVHIHGNSYYASDKPIDTWVQFYNYNLSDKIIAIGALHNGYDFGNINVFCYDGHVYLWFKQTRAYQSFSVFAEYMEKPHIGNLVESITNEAMPTEGVTRLVTITPKQSALTTDNVASATKLKTARTINGTAFDGTAGITTAKWGTARNLTIGNTAKSVDGSGPVAWSLAEIGALAATANAVSASKLATPHTLWGQSFDGTKNISGALSAVTTIDMTGDILQGDVRYGRNSGMYAEIRSGGNELVISGKGTETDMYVNYRASKFSGGTVPTVWRWMAGSGSEWASHEIGGLTTHGEVKLPYIGGTYLSMATREDVIKGALNNSATNAHALLRIMNSNGAAWVVGGTGKDVGIYGFTNERITNNDENAPSWKTTWDADTGELTHLGAMNVQSLKIGGGTITWDEANNSFRFSHTIASDGDLVAFKQ